MPSQALVTLYALDELPDACRGVALEHLRQRYWATHTGTLEGFAQDVEHDLLPLGFSDVRLLYSLGHCQGDGACFEANLDLEVFFSKVSGPHQARRALSGSPFAHARVVHRDSHYVHAYTVDVELDEDGVEEWGPDVEREASELREFLTTWVQGKCRDIEQQGYALIEELDADETLASWSQDMEFWFHGDGSIADQVLLDTAKATK